MAAKKGNNRQPIGIMTDAHRVKIQNSNILTHLIEHATGKRDMTSTQATVGIALMKKILPDLSSVDISGQGPEGEIVFKTVYASKPSG